MAKDLTFAQLSAALPAGAVTENGGDIVISANAVTGDASHSLAGEGVIEALSKLLAAASNAQATINENAAEGESLAAFSVGSLGALQTDSNGDFVSDVNYSLTSRLKLDVDNAFGPEV